MKKRSLNWAIYLDICAKKLWINIFEPFTAENYYDYAHPHLILSKKCQNISKNFKKLL